MICSWLIYQLYYHCWQNIPTFFHLSAPRSSLILPLNCTNSCRVMHKLLYHYGHWPELFLQCFFPLISCSGIWTLHLELSNLGLYWLCLPMTKLRPMFFLLHDFLPVQCRGWIWLQKCMIISSILYHPCYHCKPNWYQHCFLCYHLSAPISSLILPLYLNNNKWVMKQLNYQCDHRPKLYLCCFFPVTSCSRIWPLDPFSCCGPYQLCFLCYQN
jgi:hypothetical protein